uniref:Mitochondrial carrier protein n=1 Tax=Arcella intermedia TaxID=1963864 RepID=A0A6B2LFJ0_9EUKA
MKALYRGFWPGTVGSLPSGYLYLIVYHKSKHDLSQPQYPQTIRTWSPFLAGAIAEAASIGLFVPIDVVTQRMQLAQTTGRNFLQISTELVKNEGFLGLYRGTALTALKLGIGSGIWWIFYEYLKPSFAKFRRDPNSSGTEKLSGFLAGFFAGIASTITTNPLDVVKTRIQTQVCISSESTAVVPYKSVLDGFKRIWKTEGWKGVNRGLIPKLVSQGPLSAVWAFVYEFVLSYSISG